MSKKKVNSSNEKLIGIVTPAQWDENDNVTEVVLSATDDEVYWIENGEKFLDLVQSQIEASGSVRRDRKERRSIRIKRYRVVDEA